MAEQPSRATLAGPSMVLTLSLDAPAAVRDLRDGRTGRSLLAGPAPLVGGITAAAPRMVPIEGGVRLEWDAAGSLSLALDPEGLHWRWEGPGRAWFPFLAALAGSPDARGWRPLTTPDGVPHYRRPGWPLPLVAEDGAGRCATVLLDPGEGRSGLQTLDLLAEPGLPSPVAGLVAVHDGGWPAAFDRYRRRLRAGLDLTAGERDDLAWLGRHVVHRMVFLYGAEVADPSTGRPDAARLLAGNDEFGEVDAVLLWLAYPRLGVDRRTQWDLYDDLPGGRAALRALARSLQARGTRVLVPYKPWDRDAELRGALPVDAAELARLVADVGADGVFLDTLGDAAPGFRGALDAVGPGIVMVGENRATGAGFAAVSGSWDQPPSRDLVAGDWSAPGELLPSVDLGRFVVPEHPLFAVNRHTSGPSRERTLLRGLFGGTGFVVWQDVFGQMLPYGPAEARLLRRCARILRRGADGFRGPAPTPLVDTLAPQVAANAFAGDDGARLWTLYNAGDAEFTGPALPVEAAPGHRLVDLWHERPLPPDGSVTLPAGGVAVVAGLPQGTTP